MSVTVFILFFIFCAFGLEERNCNWFAPPCLCLSLVITSGVLFYLSYFGDVADSRGALSTLAITLGKLKVLG